MAEGFDTLHPSVRNHLRGRQNVGSDNLEHTHHISPTGRIEKQPSGEVVLDERRGIGKRAISMIEQRIKGIRKDE